MATYFSVLSFYLQHQLQILHVGLLGLDELMDVTLSLPLLRGHRVQSHQVRTPCGAHANTCTANTGTNTFLFISR